MRKNNLKKVKIIWHNAVNYKYNDIISQLTEMETVGEIVKEDKNFFVIKNPITYKIISNTKKQQQLKKPTFYAIPKGMIKKIKKIS
jgi:hypothetical protein